MVKLEFYIPDRVEYLFDFFSLLGIKIDETYAKSKKDKVLETIATLLEQKNNYRWGLRMENLSDGMNLLFKS